MGMGSTGDSEGINLEELGRGKHPFDKYFGSKKTRFKGRGISKLGSDLDEIVNLNKDSGSFIFNLGIWGDAAAMTIGSIEDYFENKGYEVSFSEPILRKGYYFLDVSYSLKEDLD